MMKTIHIITCLILIGCLSLKAQPRKVIDFNNDWKFMLSNDSTAVKADYTDAHWRALNLPHDWSIEGSFDEKHPATAQGGALPGGIGWYRKTFVLPEHKGDQKWYIEFDGIYCNSEVWINGHYLGKRPNGYISFRYELTHYINNPPQQNVIAVKANNSQQPNSRWYTGSGIYRNVRLVITGSLAIDHWGSFVTTPQVNEKAATVNVALTIKNANDQQGPVTIITQILDAAGKPVVSRTTEPVMLTDGIINMAQQLQVSAPKLWSVERPYLYKAITKIISRGKTVDEYETTFGIRYFHFDIREGFFLNGQQTKILGVCMHHDLGALGAAINVRAMERQLEILKAMGCNAIRTAHNPPAPELLDLCDRMGFIVMDEAFDMWRKRKNKFDYHLDFDQWHQQDLEAMVKRDRNHPSVIMWSIGNEIREQFDSSGIALTNKLAAIVKDLDSTRPVTAALTETDTAKNFMYRSHALDLMGLNYNHQVYGEALQKFPGMPFIATETMSALATRGHYDMPSDSIRRWPARGQKTVQNGNPDHTVSAYDNVSAYWGSTHEETWKVVKQHDFVAGLFVWTGFDYLGEPTPYPWPARSSYFGIVDLAGFPKDVYYMYQGEWTRKPVLHVFPHWNHSPGKTVDVWAYYSQADEVELFLNGRSLGVRKKQGDELHVMWRVPFEAGALKAISRKNGKTVLVKEIRTAGEPYRIELVADRKIIHAGGKDLSFITIRILDRHNNIVPDAENLIRVTVSGNGSLAAMDNGYQADPASFKKPQRKAWKGLCMAIVQAGAGPGTIKVEASAEGLHGETILLRTVR